MHGGHFCTGESTRQSNCANEPCPSKSWLCGELTKRSIFKNLMLHVLKKMGEFGGQNAHSTLNTDCESRV